MQFITSTDPICMSKLSLFLSLLKHSKCFELDNCGESASFSTNFNPLSFFPLLPKFGIQTLEMLEFEV